MTLFKSHKSVFIVRVSSINLRKQLYFRKLRPSFTVRRHNKLMEEFFKSCPMISTSLDRCCSTQLIEASFLQVIFKTPIINFEVQNWAAKASIFIVFKRQIMHHCSLLSFQFICIEDSCRTAWIFNADSILLNCLIILTCSKVLIVLGQSFIDIWRYPRFSSLKP